MALQNPAADEILSALTLVFRAQGIPITGIAIGHLSDRSTWKVGYTADATSAQRAAGAVIVAGFNPSDRAVQDVVAADKLGALITPSIRAFYAFWFKKTNGTYPTAEESSADMAELAEAYKFVTGGGK